MRNQLFIILTFLLSSPILANDFKLPDQQLESKNQIITVKPIKKTRRQKRIEKKQALSKKNNHKNNGLIAKSTREQTPAELRHNLAIYLKNNNIDLAIKYLEVLIAKVTDFIEIRDLRLQLADLYFKNEKFDKAGSVYLEYYEAYPGYMSAEYALAQAIKAKHKQIGACDQDQTMTEEVLKLGKQYLQNKAYLQYQAEIANLFDICSQQAFASELKVFEHYFKNGQLKSAQRRLDYMIKEILPKQPEVKTTVDELQELVNQAKSGKNPLKLFKAYCRAKHVNQA